MGKFLLIFFGVIPAIIILVSIVCLGVLDIIKGDLGAYFYLLILLVVIVFAFIIYKGRLLQNVLTENRISINELLSEIRSQGIGDIDEVYYACIEQNGSLSVIKKGESEMAHVLIVDGNLMEDAIKAQGYNEEWMNKQLAKEKVRKDEVFLFTVTDNGETNIIKKEKK